MPYLLVLLLSIAVGALVYLLSMRLGEGRRLTVGFGADGAPAEELEPGSRAALGYTYLLVAVTRGPSWRQRLQGFVGSLVLVVVAAFAAAGALYAIGWLVSQTIERFLND